MGNSAATVNTRLPNGTTFTASAASAANSSRFASRPRNSAGANPRCSTYARNTAAALTTYKSGFWSVCSSLYSWWLSNGWSVVVNSSEVNSSQVKTVVFSSCKSASSSPTRRKEVVVGTLPIRHSPRDKSLAQRQARVKLWLMWYFSSGAA